VLISPVGLLAVLFRSPLKGGFQKSGGGHWRLKRIRRSNNWWLGVRGNSEPTPTGVYLSALGAKGKQKLRDEAFGDADEKDEWEVFADIRTGKTTKIVGEVSFGESRKKKDKESS